MPHTHLKSSCWLSINISSILSMYLADSLHWQTRLLSSCRADLVIVNSGLLCGNLGDTLLVRRGKRESCGAHLDAMASVRRGSLVILCIGSIRKECMARPWQASWHSNSFRASTKSGLSSLSRLRVLSW